MPDRLDRLAALRALIASHPWRMRVLGFVRDLGLPDCWVAAGFVRNRVRDHLHGRPASPLPEDIDAMRHWPETATAVGVRLDAQDGIALAAPFGLDDLFDLRVRPTERFKIEKHAIYAERVRAKRWASTWPGLEIELRA